VHCDPQGFHKFLLCVQELRHYAQVVVAVAFQNKRPAIPENCSPGLRRIIEWYNTPWTATLIPP
jgi:hypothetical protein